MKLSADHDLWVYTAPVCSEPVVSVRVSTFVDMCSPYPEHAYPQVLPSQKPMGQTPSTSDQRNQ